MRRQRRPASPSAQFKLANAYVAGVGVARDPAQALRWYFRAAQQGLPDAELALGLLLIGGVAGTADPVEGYKWLLIAERGGHPESRVVREKAADQIAERDRKRAEALAQKFVPARAAGRRAAARSLARNRVPEPPGMLPSRDRRAPKSRSPSAAAPAG